MKKGRLNKQSSSDSASFEELMDSLLHSPNAKRLPVTLARTLLQHWANDTLAQKEGITLLKACTRVLGAPPMQEG